MKNTPCFRYYLVLLFILASLSKLTANSGNVLKDSQENVSEQIMENIRSLNSTGNVASIENTATTYLQELNSDGSVVNLNYDDKSNTNWEPLVHLDRLKPIILAYTLPKSKYYGDEAVYNNIVAMFHFWQNKHPLSNNWYMQEIASPQRMGVLLILLRFGPKQLPANLEKELLDRMKEEGGDPLLQTGANKLDVATHWIYRGCLVNDLLVLSTGVEQAYEPLYITTKEGFQHDYSYHQHGSQLYLGGYGRVVIAGISSLAVYLTGTPYELSGEKLELFSKFTREVYTPIIRGKYLLYNTLGRGFTRKNGLAELGFANNILTKMTTLDPQYKDFYTKTIDRIKGNKGPDYNISPTHAHFWRSDYSLHQRPGYTIDVRMASIHTARNENGNGENLKGYFLTDGASEIVLKGDEYLDIFPVWDWAKIPGTTTPDVTTIPKTASWGVSGISLFAGGVSDGKYGISAYMLNDNQYQINTKAKKAWFFFDNEIVFVGAGIASSSTENINTTVNQSLLRGDVVGIKKDGTNLTLTKDQHSFSDLSWILHDNIAYYFPQGGDISINNLPQSGTWNSINTATNDNEVISKEVFKLWINHGLAPSKGTYSYVIVPNKKSVAEINQYSTSDIEILRNSDSVQVVKHNSLNMLGLVFYKGAIFSNDEISVKADKGCIVMLKDVGNEQVKVFISDPSRQYSNIKLITKLPNIQGRKELKCALPTQPDPYAGSTFEYTIDRNSPEYNPDLTQSIYPQADAYVRSGSYGYTNYGSEKNLVVKKDVDGYGRESYLKFDLKDIKIDPSGNLSENTKISLVLSVMNVNSSVHLTSWNISHVSDDSWEESKITWRNKPTPEDMIITVPSIYAGANVIADISEFALNELLFGNKMITLHVSSTYHGGNSDASFHSRESEENLAPKLLIENLTPSGINEEFDKSSANLKIYPNPVSRGSDIFIEIPKEIEHSDLIEISVTNTLGKTLITTNNNRINIDKLTSGIYIVSVKDLNNSVRLHSTFIVK